MPSPLVLHSSASVVQPSRRSSLLPDMPDQSHVVSFPSHPTGILVDTGCLAPARCRTGTRCSRDGRFIPAPPSPRDATNRPASRPLSQSRHIGEAAYRICVCNGRDCQIWTNSRKTAMTRRQPSSETRGVSGEIFCFVHQSLTIGMPSLLLITSSHPKFVQVRVDSQTLDQPQTRAATNCPASSDPEGKQD